MENIHSRGIEKATLFVFDALTGLGDVVDKVFAKSRKQNWTLHFQKNFHKHIRKTHRKTFCKELKGAFKPNDAFYTSE